MNELVQTVAIADRDAATGIGELDAELDEVRTKHAAGESLGDATRKSYARARRPARVTVPT
eukprot:1729147-Amphidinium_carterae.1